MTLAEYTTLNDAFDESDLPFRVDIVDWAATSSVFQQAIKAHYIQLPTT